MPFGNRSVASPTGAALNLYSCLTAGKARGVVHINHGLSEHAGRYERFARFLASRGFHVYAHDHRGHGLTMATDAPPGRFAGHDGCRKVIADAEAIHELIRSEHPGTPIIAFGHSMGGLTTLNHLMRHPKGIYAAAIWNTNCAGRLLASMAMALLGWERFRMGSDVPSRILPRLTFQAWNRQMREHAPDNETGFDWLSRDSAEVQKYIDDPLCGADPSISLWRDLFGFILTAGDDARFRSVSRTMPFHLVGGGADPSTSNGQSVKQLAQRLQGMGFSNLVSTIYAQTRHESLNELNRDAIMQDFADWLENIAGLRA